MKLVETIMRTLKVNQDVAREIIDNMSVDFSEATKQEIIDDAKATYDAMNSTKGKSIQEIQAMLMELYGTKN